MVKRSSGTTGHAPQHRVRMGCLVIFGVITMVLVGTALAPGQSSVVEPPRSTQASATHRPTSEPAATETLQPVPTSSPTRMRTVIPAATLEAAALTETTTAEPTASRVATRTLTATLTPQPPTRTQTLTPTPTIFELATNTQQPAVWATNTPSS